MSDTLEKQTQFQRLRDAAQAAAEILGPAYVWHRAIPGADKVYYDLIEALRETPVPASGGPWRIWMFSRGDFEEGWFSHGGACVLDRDIHPPVPLMRTRQFHQAFVYSDKDAVLREIQALRKAGYNCRAEPQITVVY